MRIGNSRSNGGAELPSVEVVIFLIDVGFVLFGLVAGFALGASFMYVRASRRRVEPDLRERVERTLSQSSMEAAVSAYLKHVRPPRLDPNEPDHLLTAMEQANSALGALERGQYGTVRMLLIHIRRSFDSAIHNRASGQHGNY